MPEFGRMSIAKPHGNAKKRPHGQQGAKAMENEVKDEKPTTEGDPPEEPHGDKGQETDWKAMSRKWEKQAKENKDAADELAASSTFLSK